jgi:dUTP pyrophosphatase
VKLKFKRLNYLPQVDNQLIRAYPSSAGADLCANEDFIIRAGGDIVVTTGIAYELPTEPDEYGFTYHIQIWPRSGLSVKNKVENGAGLADAEYRGEVRVHLYNNGHVPFQIKKGDRIAQVVVVPCIASPWEQIQEFTEESDRGENGFGSSGV